MRRSTRIKSCVTNLSLGSRVREISDILKKVFFLFDLVHGKSWFRNGFWSFKYGYEISI